ncbi:hypothetical protein N752_03995 [Desulforamulus aquiferis]|nr:hypothetical protein N752_03995 [Desulforamulus aquiferis]
MFRKIRSPKKISRNTEPNTVSDRYCAPTGAALSPDLQGNLQLLEDIFKNCSDVIIRQFVCAQNEEIRLALIYVDGLISQSQVSDQIMRALSLELPLTDAGEKLTKANALHFIKMRGLCMHQIKETENISEAINAILSGDTVLLVDGHSRAIISGSREWASRSVEDSKTEAVVRGPREAFVETLLINTSLLRRKIKNPNLKIELLKIGEQTQTDVAVIYLDGVIDVKLVAEAKKRLSKIKIDGILESGYIEEFIRDSPYSPFSTIFHTDRPDRVAANLLEGRLAILVDGTPVALTLPTVFVEIIQNPEDYYQNYQFAMAVRILRVVTLFMSLLVPLFTLLS